MSTRVGAMHLVFGMRPVTAFHTSLKNWATTNWGHLSPVAVHRCLTPAPIATAFVYTLHRKGESVWGLRALLAKSPNDLHQNRCHTSFGLLNMSRRFCLVLAVILNTRRSFPDIHNQICMPFHNRFNHSLFWREFGCSYPIVFSAKNIKM